jgi:hypothetical protein
VRGVDGDDGDANDCRPEFSAYCSPRNELDSGPEVKVHLHRPWNQIKLLIFQVNEEVAVSILTHDVAGASGTSAGCCQRTVKARSREILCNDGVKRRQGARYMASTAYARRRKYGNELELSRGI